MHVRKPKTLTSTMAQRLEDLKLAVLIARDQLRNAKERLYAFENQRETIIYKPLYVDVPLFRRLDKTAGYWSPEACLSSKAVAYAKIAVLGVTAYSTGVAVGYEPQLLELIETRIFEREYCGETKQDEVDC